MRTLKTDTFMVRSMIVQPKILSVLIALVLLTYVAVIPMTTSLSVYAREGQAQGEHGSASEDEKGKPKDPNHWGDSASDFGNAGIMGQHSREGSAPGDAPFDENDDTKGRIGVGNNVGDGPSGHGACVDGNPETEDDDCPGA